MYKIILFIVLLILTTISSYSQNTIKGTITDNQKATVVFANVILYQNKKPVTGVVSDDDGKYIFENIANGKYKIEVSVLGYKSINSEPFELSDKNSTQNLDFTIKI